MTTLFITIVSILSVLSLGMMLINMFEFRHIQRKRITLLTSLGSERIEHERKYGSLLIWIYCITTLFVVMITIFLATVRPHVL